LKDAIERENFGGIVPCPRPVTRGASEGEAPAEKYFAPLEKCVGHNLKLLDVV